jgi:protein-disulfide isomerase
VLGAEPLLRETYIKTGKLRLIFNPVLSHFDLSEQSHLASECAAEQGRFWQMHDALFESQDALWSDTANVAKQLAADLGLDTTQFNACMDEQRYLDLLYQQDEIRKEHGIRGQPVFDIHGDLLFGAQSFETFQSLIEPKLAATPAP